MSCLTKPNGAPKVTLRRRMTGKDTIVANPFGGLVYLDVPGRSKNVDFQISIIGAIEAPWFVLGETDPKGDWLKHPAPWAELQTDKLILTVPTYRARDHLLDAAALMSHWDTIMDAMADLATIERQRKRPERIVVDIQISAGYMHAGYPIMIQNDDSAPELLSLDAIKHGRKLWGQFHEIGHNHQSDAWTFSGTTEVTVNIFTMYIIDTLCEVDLAGCRSEVGWDTIKKRAVAHVKARGTFQDWTANAFLALILYRQLQAEFGWQAFKNVFQSYHGPKALPAPRTDDAKRDHFMVRFSKEVGRNLGPLFQAWGVPVSGKALGKVESLPIWIPDYMSEALKKRDSQ